MADDTKLTEDGVELETSVVDTAVAVAAVSGPYGPAIAIGIKAASFFAEVIGWMTEEASMGQALQSIQNQLNAIQFILERIEERLDEFAVAIAITDNRATLQRLMDYSDNAKRLSLDLLNTSADDVITTSRIANEAGILIDKFLRSDYDIWKWTDVEARNVFNPQTGQINRELYPAQGKFKNLPTLPVYQMAVLTWLSARERVVQKGEIGRLDDDSGRIARHLSAVSVRSARPKFDKYTQIEDSYITSIPRSIAEHIKWRIRAFVVSSNKYPINNKCNFYYDVQNWMNGQRKQGDFFDLQMADNNVMCTINPESLGSPSLELGSEIEAGSELLHEISETLEHVAATGSLKKQFIGQFPITEVYPPAILYVISQNEELHWYRNEEASRPGGSTNWQGPNGIGTGWGGFTSVFSGGGAAIYGVQSNGDLLWYGHDGYFDGSPRWRGPRKVGWGWNGFKSIFSGGEYVVYGIQPNGDLLWYRHNGAANGGDVTTWSGPIKVGTGWANFAKVFSGGYGIIYAIREDGILLRYKHLGYLTGSLDWAPYEQIGTGWNGFQDIVAAVDGVLYAFTRDGKILWYRYGERKIPSAGGAGGGSGVGPGGPTAWSVITVWEGPIEIKRNLPAFRKVFALMDAPYLGPR
ncbi:tachylectin-related carbohydrate-binding protein [Bacillus cereus]|uniref:tachylectin-related carbohydrate-binding protein n=1 Tax=Bacillus cereus TaxID=1396 RepID=UPI0020408BDE|nr:tachylectin-related carbohydrate-binding protein [Bacillus cereus]MCM3222930.1 tachylectin-related carbohydrate-binding protein [Bacillus cereus]MEC3336018.1 tachylectin-related carbohydrate-binding protein [Bacillus cereus]